MSYRRKNKETIYFLIFQSMLFPTNLTISLKTRNKYYFKLHRKHESPNKLIYTQLSMYTKVNNLVLRQIHSLISRILKKKKKKSHPSTNPPFILSLSFPRSRATSTLLNRCVHNGACFDRSSTIQKKTFNNSWRRVRQLSILMIITIIEAITMASGFPSPPRDREGEEEEEEEERYTKERKEIFRKEGVWSMAAETSPFLLALPPQACITDRARRETDELKWRRLLEGVREEDGQDK